VALSRSAVVLYPFHGAYLASERHGLTADVIGLIVGMFALGALPAGVSNGTLAARVPEQRLAVLGLAGVAGPRVPAAGAAGHTGAVRAVHRVRSGQGERPAGAPPGVHRHRPLPQPGRGRGCANSPRRV
jgi:hypothetical protein